MCQQHSQLGIRVCNRKGVQLLSNALFSKSVIPLVFLECLECGRLKGCFKLGKNTTETFKMFKVTFAEQKMERMQHFARFFQFILNGFLSLLRHVPSTKGAECLGCPTSTRAKHTWIKEGNLSQKQENEHTLCC